MFSFYFLNVARCDKGGHNVQIIEKVLGRCCRLFDYNNYNCSFIKIINGFFFIIGGYYCFVFKRTHC